jgi:hypothetical protein
MGDDPAGAVFSDTEDGLLGAQTAVGCVVEDVAFEGAGGFLFEAGVFEALRQCPWIGDAELYFNFEVHEDSL